VSTKTVSGARRILALLWYASLTLVVGLVVATHAGRAAGFETFAIRGASMAPALPLGSLVVVTPVDPGRIAVGDVVTFQADNGVVVTHRVVEVDASEADAWLRLKGDANESPDPVPVPVRSVVGTVAVVLPLAGYLVGMLTMPIGMVSVIAWFLAIALAGTLLDERATRQPSEQPDRHASLATG
jgi:signal peptidase